MTNTQPKPATSRKPTAAFIIPNESAATIPAPPRPAKLEKIAPAASRMAVSVAQVYREAKAGRLTIIKLGVRASALDSAQVDAWITARISEAQQGAARRAGGAQ